MSKKIILIQDMIYEIRGYQVMLDADLAKIYQGVLSAEKMQRLEAAFFPIYFGIKKLRSVKCTVMEILGAFGVLLSVLL